MDKRQDDHVTRGVVEPGSGAASAPVDHLQRHILNSYLALRIGIGVIGLAFPLILWWIGYFFFDIRLRPSMSAYYGTPMRNVFVGLLFVVGAFLYLYKGFSNRENVALNCAGLSAGVVALVPEGTSWAHGTFAIFLFLCVGYVTIFRNGDTLEYILDTKRKALYKHTYRTLGALMIVLPLVAYVLISGLQYHLDVKKKNIVFGVELAGIWAFAAYWLVKSREIWRTQKDALEASETEAAAPVQRGYVEGQPKGITGPLETASPTAIEKPVPKARPEARFLA
jgi:hypothetical protein